MKADHRDVNAGSEKAKLDCNPSQMADHDSFRGSTVGPHQVSAEGFGSGK